MQSIRQYRRFKALIEEQLDNDKRKQDALLDQSSGESRDRTSPYGASRSRDEAAIDHDPEKMAASAPAGSHAREARGRQSPPAHRQSVPDDGPKEEEEDPITDPEKAEAESPEDEARRKDGLEPIRPAHAPRSRTSSRGSSRVRRTLSRMSTRDSVQSLRTGLGKRLTGVEVRRRTTKEEGDHGAQVFVVGFHDDNDSMNPHNFSLWTRIMATFTVATIGAVVGIASSIDSSALTEAAEEFGVSEVVESLATGLYLAGFGCGALFAGPISETLGRNPVYIITLTLYMIFIMASGLAPNIGAQLAFRFLAGFFGSTPLTCAGGSVADMWDPLQRVYTFPIFANFAFLGPILGPVMGGWIASSPLISWRWTEWITLIISGLVLANVVVFQPETYSGVILMWKAKHLRELTGDKRYVAPMEVSDVGLRQRLTTALYRPFILTFQEPIIILVTLYLTVIYVILFTFLDGYDYIFAEIHGTSPGITGVCFLGIAVGLFGSSALIPLIYKWAKEELAKVKEQGGTKLPPEFRLWYAMLGSAVCIPVSLFWMGWTSYPSISIWSPLLASVLFGYGILGVFISSYQYIIDSYEIYAASALASVTLIRYVASGGMVVVGIPFYENLGVHYTLTVLGGISAAMVPVPYIFYKYGPWIRKYSKYAVTQK